jgi:hypothetical protein
MRAYGAFTAQTFLFNMIIEPLFRILRATTFNSAIPMWHLSWSEFIGIEVKPPSVWRTGASRSNGRLRVKSRQEIRPRAFIIPRETAPEHLRAAISEHADAFPSTQLGSHH